MCRTSKRITITHPITNLPFRFFVDEQANAQVIVEALEYHNWNYLAAAKADRLKLDWNDNLRAMAKGTSLREIAPQAYQDLLKQAELL